jgi:predicted Rossmann fold nucleotide-binding protein DprA/Smf involved in DNA uptake
VERNALVAALADELFIAHARSGSKTFDLARQALDKGKRIYTIGDPANLELLALGGQPISQQIGA